MPITKPLIRNLQEQVEPTWKTVAKGALDAVTAPFVDDPMAEGADQMSWGSKIGSLLTALPSVAPLVSIYKNKAAREVATEAFRRTAYRQPWQQAAHGTSNTNLAIAVNTFADKYPRVAAHMNISPQAPMQHRALASIELPEATMTRPLDMQIGMKGRKLFENDLDAAVNTMFHEGTHVAQALGNKDTTPLYSYAEDVVGYRNNPFEVNARRAGDKAIGRDVAPYRNATSQLVDISQRPPGLLRQLTSAITGTPDPAEEAKFRIQAILRERHEAGTK